MFTSLQALGIGFFVSFFVPNMIAPVLADVFHWYRFIWRQTFLPFLLQQTPMKITKVHVLWQFLFVAIIFLLSSLRRCLLLSQMEFRRCFSTSLQRNQQAMGKGYETFWGAPVFAKPLKMHSLISQNLNLHSGIFEKRSRHQLFRVVSPFVHQTRLITILVLTVQRWLLIKIKHSTNQ